MGKSGACRYIQLNRRGKREKPNDSAISLISLRLLFGEAKRARKKESTVYRSKAGEGVVQRGVFVCSLSCLGKLEKGESANFPPTSQNHHHRRLGFWRVGWDWENWFFSTDREKERESERADTTEERKMYRWELIIVPVAHWPIGGQKKNGWRKRVKPPCIGRYAFNVKDVWRWWCDNHWCLR